MTRDDPAAFAPPPAFGPFRVLHQIGIGALGPVFRTYEPTRDRLVAVKVFRLDITPEQSELLAAELAVAADAGLFHPSIVEPIAAGVEGTVAYRAEEYVAAESLDVAIRHYAPAPLQKALPFITQLAGAIDFARTAGVGHGALHLRDVFVTPDEARASGFGIVEALERVGIRAPVRRPYSAPERIAGDSWSTPADVFSLGAIAFELLTARRPSGTGDQIGAFPDEILGRYAAAIHGVLARAMDDNPARRYPSALALASALEAAARGGHVSDAVRAVGAISAATGSPPVLDTAAEATAAVTSTTQAEAEAVSEPSSGPANQPSRRRRRSAEASAKAQAGHDATPDAGAEPSSGPADAAHDATSGPAEAGRHAMTSGPASTPARTERAPGTPAEAGHQATSSDPADAGRHAMTSGPASTPARTERAPGTPAEAGHYAMSDTEPETNADAEPEIHPDDGVAVEEHDVAAERDADTAHHELLRREIEGLPQPMLFDDDEAVADLALHAGPMPRDFSLAELDPEDWRRSPAIEYVPEIHTELTHEFAAPESHSAWHADDAVPILDGDDRTAAFGGAHARATGEDSHAMIAERPRPAMLPLAVTLVFGLLVGFAAGYAVGDRGQASEAQTAARLANPVPAAPASSPAARPQDGGQAFSEQTVAKPPIAPPPVPGDAPSRTAAESARGGAVGAGRPSATTGRIIVQSTPSNAGVVVNGTWRGRTPLTLDRLKFGAYSVRVVQPGFTAARQDMTLTAAEPSHSIAFRLERGRGTPPSTSDTAAPAVSPPASEGARSAGSIYVDSRPRGARVMIDGRAAGTTPARVADMTSGSHVVRLELADYRPWTASTRVAAGKETRVTGSLERIR